MDNTKLNNDVTEKIKSYLKRLGEGEKLEAVRADFVKEFSEVDPAQIMEAEQQLIKEGTSINEVQKLCDVHAALFHGTTIQEKIINAERAAAESIRSRKETLTAKLINIPNHPLNTFTRENEQLKKIISRCRETQDKTDNPLMNELRQISIHYAKKGDLLYPHLAVQYGVTGPSNVMWTVDDEIRDEVNALAKAEKRDSAWNERFTAVLTRAEEMIYKENNILFPNCAVNFTDEEWYGVYYDSKDYAECFAVDNGKWDEAESYRDEYNRKRNLADSTPVSDNGEIVLAGGHFTIEQLTAVLNTIPIEITFVDDNDTNVFFNEGPKVFKRPGMALGRKVYSCHPPKIEKQVRRIIQEFKDGTLDEVPIWMNKNGTTFLVKYMAVRDKNGKYLGTMELVQDMEFARKYFE